MEELFDISLSSVEIQHIWVFYLFPIPILVWLIIPAIRSNKKALFSPAYSNIKRLLDSKEISLNKSQGNKWYKWIFLIVIWALLLLAFSSPQLVGIPEKKVKNSRNFLIVADLSLSMDEKDWPTDNGKVSRWDGVKDVLHDFVDTREGDRMGLVFFGSQAYTQAPFTTDLNLVNSMMDDVAVGMAGQMTSIGNAIAKGIEMFEKDSIKYKVMLVMTDGVDSGSDILPLDAAAIAKKDSITIYTLGIGQKGAGSYELDENTLKEIASISGGEYFKADDENSLQKITETLNKYEPMEYEEESYKPVTLLYFYPLGIAYLLGVVYYLFAVFVRVVKSVIK